MFYTSCSSKLCQVHSTELPSSLPPLQTTTGPCHWHGSARGSNPDQGPLGLESGHQKTSEKRWKKKWFIYIYYVYIYIFTICIYIYYMYIYICIIIYIIILYIKTTRICGGQCCSEVKKSAPVRRRCPPHKRLHQANHLESCREPCGTGMFRNDRLCQRGDFCRVSVWSVWFLEKHTACFCPEAVQVQILKGWLKAFFGQSPQNGHISHIN